MFETNILFTGFYGQSNTGDDAFVEVAAWGAEKYWNKDCNRFLAKSSRLPHTVTPVRGYPFTFPRTYKTQAEYLLKRTTALVFAGGSTIHSKLGKDNLRMKALHQKAAGKDLKIGGIGVSVGPFKSVEDEKAVQDYLKKLDFLAVRDQASFDYVSNLDLPYQPINAFDLAALLPNIYEYVPPTLGRRKKKIIGVSVCPFESVKSGGDVNKETQRNRMIVDLLQEIDALEEVHFRFYIINGNDVVGDKLLTNETVAKVFPKSYEVINYSLETEKIWRSIADCDFVISTRLHAAIFACFANTPFMLNEYHKKCSDFLDTVEYFDQYRLHNSQYDVKAKAVQILNIMNEAGIYRKPRKVETMQIQASLNFTKIDL